MVISCGTEMSAKLAIMVWLFETYEVGIRMKLDLPPREASLTRAIVSENAHWNA